MRNDCVWAGEIGQCDGEEVEGYFRFEKRSDSITANDLPTEV